MATYRQIHTKIWSSPDFQALSPNAKLVFIYTFSNDHRNEACLYRITPKTIANETELTVEEIKAALEEIEAQGMIKYDPERYLMWVINAVRYQKISPNEVTAIQNNLAAYEPHPFVEEFRNYYADILRNNKATRKVLRSTSKDTSSTSKDTSGKGKGKGKGNISINNITSELGSSDAPSQKQQNPIPLEAPRNPEDQSPEKTPEELPGESKPSKYLPVHLELAEHLRRRILENKPDARLPRSLGKWAETARLMIERDGRSPERIRQVIDWCQSHHFWWRNILSMDKLRQQFDRLEAEMNGAARDSPKKAQREGIDYRKAYEDW